MSLFKGTSWKVVSYAPVEVNRVRMSYRDHVA